MSRRPPTPDASGGLRSIVGGRMLRMARTLSARHEPTSAELKLARHMAQSGHSWNEIQSALMWECHIATVKYRLRRFNIFPRVGANANDKLSRYGGQTTISGGVPLTHYRPKRMGVR